MRTFFRAGHGAPSAGLGLAVALLVSGEFVTVREDAEKREALEAELRSQHAELRTAVATYVAMGLKTFPQYALPAEVSKVNAEITGLQGQLENMRGDHRSLEGRVTALEIRVLELESTIQNLPRSVTAHEADLGGVSVSTDRKKRRAIRREQAQWASYTISSHLHEELLRVATLMRRCKGVTVTQSRDRVVGVGSIPDINRCKANIDDGTER